MRRAERLLLIGLLLLLSLPEIANAERSQLLKGTVSDEEGRPMPSVRITVTTAGEQPNVSMTDASGTFAYYLKPGKAYQIDGALEGYISFRYPEVEIPNHKAHPWPLLLEARTRVSTEITCSLTVIDTSKPASRKPRPKPDPTKYLEGRVVDLYGDPIPGVRVSVTSDSMTADVFTDPSGAFRTEPLLPDRYLVQVSDDGYLTLEFPDFEIHSSSSRKILLNVTLQKRPIDRRR